MPLCSLSCSQTWLSLLLEDHQSTIAIKLGGGNLGCIPHSKYLTNAPIVVINKTWVLLYVCWLSWVKYTHHQNWHHSLVIFCVWIVNLVMQKAYINWCLSSYDVPNQTSNIDSYKINEEKWIDANYNSTT